MSKTILIMEDEQELRQLLRAFLEDAGYRVLEAGDGETGLAIFEREAVDLVLLDVLMPRLDGYAVCRRIRVRSQVPVIMLTALDGEDDALRGYDVQVDDYVTKTVSMLLLLRRIEAVLRRVADRRVAELVQKGRRVAERSVAELVQEGESVGSKDDAALLSCGQVMMDTARYEVMSGGRLVTLTAREFEILRLFLEHPGRVFTRTQLIDQIWGYDFVGDARIVNTHIKNLRHKLGSACIETVRGVGYRVVCSDA